MREIIFRGKEFEPKHTSDGWVTGFYSTKDGAHFITTIGRYTSGKSYFSDVLVNPETIGQYTGLTDKNGKKIFEGDIVKFTRSGDIRTVIFDEYYAEFEFNPKDPVSNPDGVCLCADHDACEVIGNVYDNHELVALN